MQPALFCTKEFLHSHPRPEHPGDLARLPFIAQTSEGRPLVTCSKKGQVETVALQPRHTVQSIGLALELLLANQGVTTLIPQLAKAFDKEGRLVQLLPDWELTKTDINLTLPGDRPPKRVRLFVDHIVKHFQSL